MVPPTHNLLLGSLPADEYARLEDFLSPVEMPHGQSLVPPSGEMHKFHFVAGGLVSLLHTTAEGESAEISLVGREGAIGLPLALGGQPFPVEAVVQAPCAAWVLPAQRLREEFARGGALQLGILRFTHALMAQMAHTVVCNRHHSVELQLCRWILLSLDRLPGEELRMTQEMIAQMLGVRRAGVNEATTRLENEGLLEHTRGQIRVLDRTGLEARACECYRNIRDEYGRLVELLLPSSGGTAQQAP